MDDGKETKPLMVPYATPLVLSMAGIICSTMAIAVYHCIFLRYFVTSQRMERRNDSNTNTNCTKNGGVQEEILDKIPVFSISTKISYDFLTNHSECSICLGQLEDGDQVRLLPSCNHAFHKTCIDAWFKDHADCPICRSPITNGCELATPIKASENVGDSHVHRNIPTHDHHQLINNNHVSGSTSRFQRPSHVLPHSLSSSSHARRKPQALIMGSRRSLSLDLSLSSYIAINIQRDEEEASTSSSTKGFMMSQYSCRHLDHKSSILRLQNSRNGRHNAILPV